MGDGSYRRQLAVDRSMPGSGEISQAYLTPLQAESQTRPLSWHPSAYPAYEASYQPVYNSTITDYSLSFGNGQDLPNTPALQSNYGSPSVAFSPESQPWTGYDQEYQLYDTTSLMQPSLDNTMTNYNVYAPYQLQLAAQTEETNYNDCMNPSIYQHFDWNNFAATGFEDGTAPPTPENFLPIQHPDPPCAIEPTIPYHSLDDQEEEGEILVGMGLYDTLEKPSLPDLQLEQYKTAMMSQYLGSTCRTAESIGKGLKLEETWQPPNSDEEEDDEDKDGERDAEGSDDEDEQQSGQQGHARALNEGNRVESTAAPQITVQLQDHSYYQGEGWL